MEPLVYSFIIPVYNRPQEIDELLQSFTDLEGDYEFEIIIIEDGSQISSKSIVDSYADKLNISYLIKTNSGPGDSRNYGMKRANGNFFIILDSDVIIPKDYLKVVNTFQNKNFFHCFGGPDSAHGSFTNLQKAINFTMTSFLTTGGIRGHENSLKNFQPRSFNMGLSKEAFIATGGFGKIHPGEDPDLSLRLNKLGYETALIKDAFVYHKRRISWASFFKQVYKFGSTRPILNQWHPQSASVVYWFPTLFLMGLIVALVLFFLNIKWPICLYLVYFIVAIILSAYQNKNLIIGLQSGMAIFVQFLGYGFGFLRSTFILKLTSRSPEEALTSFFFK